MTVENSSITNWQIRFYLGHIAIVDVPVSGVYRP